MDEKKIASLMKSLGCTREEAIAVIQEDEEIDKMTMKEINADLTPEQRKAMKDATKTGTKKRTAVKRERKPDEEKADIISQIAEFLKTIDPRGAGRAARCLARTYVWEKFLQNFLQKVLDICARKCYTVLVKGREALRNNLVETENSSKKKCKKPLDKLPKKCYTKGTR